MELTLQWLEALQQQCRLDGALPSQWNSGCCWCGPKEAAARSYVALAMQSLGLTQTVGVCARRLYHEVTDGGGARRPRCAVISPSTPGSRRSSTARLYKAESIYHLGTWKGLEDVESATLEWVA